MGFWSKLYIDGQLIATDTTSGVEIYITMRDEVPFALLKQTANGLTIGASVQRLEDIPQHIAYDAEFNIADLQNMARDSALRELFENGFIKGAFLGNNVVLGMWSADYFPFAGTMIPGSEELLRQVSSWKPADYYLDARPSRNVISYPVDAVLGIPSRAGLVYKMEIKKPSFPGAGTLETIETLQGSEIPERIEAGVSYLDGWQPEIDWHLDGCLQWDLPENQNVKLMIHQRVTMPFYVKTWAEQNGLLVAGSETSTALLWAIKARLNEEDFASWKSRIYSKYIGENGKWLTWQPNGMEVSEDMPVYLSFLVNRKPTPEKITVYVQIFYRNGSYEYFEKSSISGVAENSVISVAMGYSQLGLDYEDGDSIVSYTVWLVDENYRRISRKRTFYVDRKIRTDARVLLFQNSLGGIDTVRFTGKPEDSLQIAGVVSEKGMVGDYKTIDEQMATTHKTGVKTNILTTGPSTNKWLRYYEEIGWTERACLVTKEGFVAVNLEKVNLPLAAKGETMGHRSFVFTKSKTSVGFSDMPLAPAEVNRPTAWIGVQPYCLIDSTTGFRTGIEAFNSLKLHYIDTTPPEAVKNIPTKSNTPGSADYIAPINSAACVAGTAVAVNTVLNKQSTFAKSDCANGSKGTTYMITVDAGMFGGNTVAEANDRALAEYNRRNTQENANLPGNGSCVLLQEGLDGRYINYIAANEANPNTIFAQVANATRVDVHINNPQMFPPSGINSSYYAIEQTGYLKAIETGNILLQLEHKHGVRMYVNGVLLIDNWNSEGISECIVQMVTGTYYQIKVQYGYRNTGVAKYVLNWGKVGNQPALVPAYVCFR